MAAATCGDASCDADHSKVPVTILTGFLGAGKTTLLNHILTGDHGLRIAVVENEFGKTGGLEAIVAKDGVDSSGLEGIFEMRNGCVCCSIKEDLVETLEALVTGRIAGDKTFDAVVIETTGLANPGPVATAFWLDDALESCLQLDAIVAVVDAKNMPKYLEEKHSPEATAQVAFADRLLLNKADLVADVAELQRLEGVLRAVNPTAELRRTTRCDVPLDWVLRTRCFGRNVEAEVQRALAEKRGDNLGAAPGMGWAQPVQRTEVALHLGLTVGTVALEAPGVLERRRLRKFLADLLWDNGGAGAAEAAFDGDADANAAHRDMQKLGDMEVLRVKGGAWLDDGGGGEGEGAQGEGEAHEAQEPQEEAVPHLIQGVYDLFEVTPFRGDDLPDWLIAGRNRVVIIGRNLDATALEQRLQACVRVGANRGAGAPR